MTMRSKHIFLLLLLNSAIPGIISDSQQGFPHGDITYEELDLLELTCHTLDNCQRNRREDDLTLYNCHCESICAVLDTCCVDSNFRNTRGMSMETNIKCLTVYGETMDVFMVDSCRRDWDGDESIESLCLSNSEVSNDPFLLVPVTSPRTGTTYKNYFCAVCNENTESTPPTLWNIKLSGTSELISKPLIPTLTFNQTLKSWAVQSEKENGAVLPVLVSLEVPQMLSNLVKKCRLNVVSKCSEHWTDVTTEEKCAAYTAIIVIHKNESSIRYKNPHCAICNFESVEMFSCTEDDLHRVKPVSVSGILFVGLFTFEEKRKRCRNNMVYDMLAKKCRVVRCGRYEKMADGKCTVKAGHLRRRSFAWGSWAL